MAQVIDDYERPTTIQVIDPRELLPDDEAPPTLPDIFAPSALRAFVVAKDPKMTVIPHFFSEEECDHLIQLVDGYWVPSLVGQATYSSEEQYSKGDLENALSNTRTSWSCMMRYSQTAIVERLERRLSAVAGLPVEQMERMNMVRYAPGEQFAEHHDGKFRPRTIFVYLNDLHDLDEEGDTFFPILGLSFKPRRGAAVIWSNVDGDENVEDSRMLHSGRAPTRSVKYGVNCFFNAKPMRQFVDVEFDVTPEECTLFDTNSLDPENSHTATPKLTAFRLFGDPQIFCVKQFMTSTEIDHVMGLVIASKTVINDTARKQSAFKGGTRTVLILAPSETPTLELIEARLAGVAGLPVGHLGQFRVVQPPTNALYCNRGCGPKSAYVCFCEEEELVFTRLSLRLTLHRGDVLVWPNVDWERTGKAMEDLRTVRFHRLPEHNSRHADWLGLDAFFHDNPVRDQRAMREFVSDADVKAR